MQTTASLPPPHRGRSHSARPRSAVITDPDGSTPFGLVPFTLTHFAMLEMPAILHPSLRLFAMGYHAAGPALTFVERDRVIGCAGLAIEGSEAQAWAFFSAPLSRRSLKRLHRSFRRSLPKLKRLHDLGGIRTEVHPDDIFGRRWVAYLGFRFDGVAAPCPLLGERMLRYLYR